MYFVGSNSDLYFVLVTAVMWAISCYTGSGYNGTPLYKDHVNLSSYKLNNIIV